MRQGWKWLTVLVIGCGDQGTGDADPVGTIDTNDDVTEVEDLDADGFNSLADCDDQNDRVHPGAPELCDGIDNDCDDLIDDADDSVDGSTYSTYDVDEQRRCQCWRRNLCLWKPC